MNPEERIRDLEQQLNDLSVEMQVSQQKLQRLQKELRLLKQAEGPALPSGESQVMSSSAGEETGIEQFIGLRLIHLVGIIVLVIGLSIGVKYAIDGQLISEMMRIVLAFAAGAALFILSQRLKRRYTVFSAILFSGSMASVYFTTYASFAYYHFIPGTLAFVIMAALTVYTTMMALRYDRIEIAIIGMAGAYGIPFLVSANSERFELFFSYIFLINIGIVFLSFRKAWKLVGLLAMLITWTLFTGWALMRYEPADSWLGLLFMILFYLLFCLNALSPAVFRQQRLVYFDIQQIVVNNGAVYVAALCLFAATWVSGILCIVFSVSAMATAKLLPQEKRLQRVWMVIALIALLIWILLRWDGLTVTLSWTAVSVLLFAWGIAGRQSWIRLTAVLLMGITLGKLLVMDSGHFSPVQKIICYVAIGVLLLLFSFYYQRLGLALKDKD